MLELATLAFLMAGPASGLGMDVRGRAQGWAGWTADRMVSVLVEGPLAALTIEGGRWLHDEGRSHPWDDLSSPGLSPPDCGVRRVALPVLP